MELIDLHRATVKIGEKLDTHNERLLNLVEKSATETAKANAINDKLNDSLKGVKRTTRLEFFTKISSFLIVLLFLGLLLVAVRNGTPIKYGDIEVNMPEHVVVDN